MGYYYRGFISSDKIVSICKDKFKNIKIINLYQNLVTIPLTDELYDEINMSNGIAIENYEYLTDKLGLFCMEISIVSSIAYIEAEYFGGVGSQNGIVWEKETVVFNETNTDNAINQVLELLGINKANDRDEFDTVGFGRHRYIEDWINEEPDL